MTYAAFLALYIALPSAALAWSAGRRGRLDLGARVGLAGVSALAFASALPWDSAAIRRGYWYFAPARLCGAHLGNVPLEEASFFVLEALLVGLCLLHLLPREDDAARDSSAPARGGR